MLMETCGCVSAMLERLQLMHLHPTPLELRAVPLSGGKTFHTQLVLGYGEGPIGNMMTRTAGKVAKGRCLGFTTALKAGPVSGGIVVIVQRTIIV
mmetsp:Transcript_11479/g.20032  ORF Transcript_11479/g.20032 Transcript_11479/m.20032 type:complete len:95 (+) Transcript_11479:69-353(+)